jgi:hypothetical protein
MHSKVFTDLVIAKEIIYQPRSAILSLAAATAADQVIGASNDLVPTIAGMIVMQSDAVEVISGTPDTYAMYLLGDEAMGFFFQRSVNIDEDRSIFLKEDYWSPDLNDVMTLFGMDYTSTDFTFTEIKKTANWTLKWDARQVKAVRYISQ